MPAAPERRVAMSPGENNDSNKRRGNLAARMGRWSANHWKTATFGWLAFVLVAFALGSMVGTKQVDQNTPGPGESGRMQKILDQNFKEPVGESVLIQSNSSQIGDPAFNAAIRDVIAGVSKVAVVQNVRRGPGLAGPALGAGRVRHPRRPEEGGGQGPARPRQRHRRPASPPRLRHRRVRSRERRQGRQARRTATISQRPGSSRFRSR